MSLLNLFIEVVVIITPPFYILSRFRSKWCNAALERKLMKLLARGFFLTVQTEYVCLLLLSIWLGLFNWLSCMLLKIGFCDKSLLSSYFMFRKSLKKNLDIFKLCTFSRKGLHRHPNMISFKSICVVSNTITVS